MAKPRLLHIIPYNNLVPPKNGGALRCYYLCTELSKYYDVTLLTYQEKSSIKDRRFSQIEVINPKRLITNVGSLNKIKHAVLYRWYNRSFKGPAEAVVLNFYPVIKVLSQTHHFDVVLMEHLSSMHLGKLIKKHFPKALRIVDQHNIDHQLFEQNHHLNNPVNQKRFKHIKQQESLMYTYADYFLACSQHDVEGLEQLNKQKISGIVVPNGTEDRQIDIKHKDFSKPHLLFCGSLDYEPNKNGLLWFFKDIWPMLKTTIADVKLTVIGRNGNHKDYVPLKQDSQIDFIGEVEDVSPYYHRSTLAIVPLLEGSGTRLKILEAMSFGVPVVSTTVGADGIDYCRNQNIFIENEAFKMSNQIMYWFNNIDKLKLVADQARQLIKEKYQWDIIVAKTVCELNLLKTITNHD